MSLNENTNGLEEILATVNSLPEAGSGGNISEAIAEHNADSNAHSDIRQLLTGKVNISDIVNNLTTNATDKPLSAAQGAVLRSKAENAREEAENAFTQAEIAISNASDASHAAENAQWTANQASSFAQDVSDRVDNLTKDFASKAYLVGVFEELKTALETYNGEMAIAVLDRAILDLSTLA